MSQMQIVLFFFFFFLPYDHFTRGPLAFVELLIILHVLVHQPLEILL